MSSPDLTTREIERLWTYEDLMARWGVGARQVRRTVAKLRLRAVPLGSRTIRFRPCAVLKAEEEAEQRGTKNEERRTRNR